MLGYCTLGTNDLQASAEFYEPIARILGHSRVMETERTVMWGSPGQGAMFCVIKPLNEQDATVGNGTMFGFAADTDEQVDRIYAHALAHGGSDEGPRANARRSSTAPISAIRRATSWSRSITGWTPNERARDRDLPGAPRQRRHRGAAARVPAR